MYEFWCSLRSTDNAVLLGILFRAARHNEQRQRAGDSRPVHRLSVRDSAAAALPACHRHAEVDVAIIGGKLLFDESEVGQPRGQRKLYAETVFCNERAAAALHGMDSPLSDPRWGEHAVAQQLLTDSSVAVTDAARISIADMIYFRCAQHRGDEYIGGVLDLFPVEIARARHGSDHGIQGSVRPGVLDSRWRAVLGVDGNARLRYANSHLADMRIDSSDVSVVLEKQQLQQKLDWLRNRIELRMPPSYEIFVQHMNDQWQYGYQRAQEALAAAASSRRSAAPTGTASRWAASSLRAGPTPAPGAARPPPPNPRPPPPPPA
jgi:hypothetical protein